MMNQALQLLAERTHLSREIARSTMEELMSGRCSEAQLGAFLMGLRFKGETVEEITALAETMRTFCVRIEPRVNGVLTDVVGTGGARLKTFNVSTVSAFVAAGAGVPVAKHGNRGVTSGCGSADLLEALGLNLNLEASQVSEAVEQVGIGFLFAPKFHPAMKHVAKARKELGIRTVFNILGPLANPAGARAQLLGVFNEELVEVYTHVVQRLGVERALVVYGIDGIDEISITGETRANFLQNGTISQLTLNPKMFGFQTARPEEIASLPPAQSARVTYELLVGKIKDARYEMVLCNAGAAIYVGGAARSIEEGIEKAETSLQSGAALDKLRRLIEHSGGALKRELLWTI